MARLIKDWLRAKKGICTSDCQCLTIAGWKCYAEENLCNCGYKKKPTANTEQVQTPAVQSQEEDTVFNDVDLGGFGDLPDAEADVITLDELNS